MPQALFEAGDGAPVELRPAFAAAHREWMLSTDFERTIGVLKAHLADSTADAAARPCWWPTRWVAPSSTGGSTR